MNIHLKIKKDSLESIEHPDEYLELITSKYYDLMKDKNTEWSMFTEDQLTLHFYMILYNQVQNGGFIQLLWNGYFSYTFETPLIETISEWGAKNTAKILEKIKLDCSKLAEEIADDDKTDLKLFSKLYEKYPQFDAFDKEFYDEDGVDEVKKYVENHLNDFIIIE